MHVAVITAVWRRYMLTALYWRWAAHLTRWWAAHQVDLIAAVSDDEHEQLAVKAGAVAVRVPNHPLGAKFNAALTAARDRGADAVLVMGSDDFLCERVAGALLAAALAGAPYVGLEDLYFLDGRTGYLRYWRGYRPPRRGEPAGCGRLLSRALLDQCDWQLWAPGIHKGMDHSAMRTAAAIARPTLLNVRALGGCAVDVKTTENIDKFEPGHGPQVATDEILERLPPDLVRGLEALRHPATRRNTMAPDTMRLRLVKNVSYHGLNYGPDYDEQVVDVAIGDARGFLHQGRAVPAETSTKRLGPVGDTESGGTTREAPPRTADPAITTTPAKPTKRTKGRRKKKS